MENLFIDKRNGNDLQPITNQHVITQHTWLAIVIALTQASVSTSSVRHISCPSGPVIPRAIIFFAFCKRVMLYTVIVMLRFSIRLPLVRVSGKTKLSLTKILNFPPNCLTSGCYCCLIGNQDNGSLFTGTLA